MMEAMKVSVTTPIATPKMVSDERSLFALTVATAIAADSFMSSKDMLNSKAPPSSVALLLAAPLKPRQQRTYQEHVGHGQGFDVPVSFVQVGAQEFVAPLVREKLLVATVGPVRAVYVVPDFVVEHFAYKERPHERQHPQLVVRAAPENVVYDERDLTRAVEAIAGRAPHLLPAPARPALAHGARDLRVGQRDNAEPLQVFLRHVF